MAKNSPIKKSKDIKIKEVGLIYRPATEKAQKVAGEMADWLKSHGISTYSLHPERKIRGSKKIARRSTRRLDLVMVLGGDGTYLNAVHLLDDPCVPVLGVNLGSLGFLTETRLEDLYRVIEAVVQGRAEVRYRSMLKVQVRRKGRKVNEFNALNDTVIERGFRSHLIHMAIFSDRRLVYELKADGLIVATPTGSTAYNLSAGGPILHPTARALAITPISPHSLTSRPLVFPDDRKLAFRIMSEDQKAELTIDGQQRAVLGHEDEVVVQRNRQDHCMLVLPSNDFFQLLRDKLKFGQRD